MFVGRAHLENTLAPASSSTPPAYASSVLGIQFFYPQTIPGVQHSINLRRRVVLGISNARTYSKGSRCAKLPGVRWGGFARTWDRIRGGGENWYPEHRTRYIGSSGHTELVTLMAHLNLTTSSASMYVRPVAPIARMCLALAARNSRPGTSLRPTQHGPRQN
jgi:hypothetical protein